MLSWLNRIRSRLEGRKRRCSHCGAEVSASARTCFMCGEDLPAPRRQQIQTSLTALVRGAGRTCPHCGAAVSRSARVCSVCDQPLSRPRRVREPPPNEVSPAVDAGEVHVDRRPERRTCPSCGARVAADASVCPMCSADLHLAAFEQATAEAAAAATEAQADPALEQDPGPELLDRDTAPAAGERPVCPNCGAPAARTAKQCTVCGQDLSVLLDTEQAAPPRRSPLRNWWLWGVVGVAAIVIASGTALWTMRPEPPPPPTATHTRPPPTATFTPTLTSTPTSTPTPTPTYTPTPTSTPIPTSTPTPTPTPIIHVVQPGEVLLQIARTYAVTLRELLRANGITEAHILHPDDELIIPASGQLPTPFAPPSEVVHVVQEGDRLADIAERYGVSTGRIRAANDLAPDAAIRVGQELIVPLPATPAPSRPTPTTTPTAGPRYPAPQLLYPPENGSFAGEETTVMLQWTSVGILAPDEWYAVHLRYLGERTAGRPNEHLTYTRATSWRVPAEWYPGAGSTAVRFEWKVEVVRVVDGETEPEVISSSGFVRRFSWE